MLVEDVCNFIRRKMDPENKWVPKIGEDDLIWYTPDEIKADPDAFIENALELKLKQLGMQSTGKQSSSEKPVLVNTGEEKTPEVTLVNEAQKPSPIATFTATQPQKPQTTQVSNQVIGKKPTLTNKPVVKTPIEPEIKEERASKPRRHHHKHRHHHHHHHKSKKAK